MKGQKKILLSIIHTLHRMAWSMFDLNKYKHGVVFKTV